MSAPAPRILLTGLGLVAAPALHDALDGKLAAPPERAPEITGFETPEGAPAFGFEAPEFKLEAHLPHIKSFVDRTSAFALAAAKLALADAGLLEREARPAGLELGCAYGTALGCLEAMEIFWKKVKANPKFAAPLPFTHGYANSPSSLLCIEFGLKGAAATFSGEPLAGVEALLFARDQLRRGSASCVLVCASESLTRAAHAHAWAEKLLSPSGALRPWQGYDGAVPGEGGACLVLETEASAAARGAQAHAELAAVQLAGGGGLAAAARPALEKLGPQAGPALLVTSAPGPRDAEEKSFWTAALPAGTAVAPKCFAGELLSAAPLAGAFLAARALQAQRPAGSLPGAWNLGANAAHEPPAVAFIDALDAGGPSAVFALKAV
ncbi:MAG: hypothetical protein M5U26_10785 [Planctomycetota bacterium]|nr:hypothetical protein [Planctomycetota bacterium]